MADKNHVIRVFEECLCNSHSICSECYQQGPGFGFVCRNNVCIEVLSMIKEQEEREQAICKEICDFIRSACSTDTEDDKDYVCYEIQKCFTEGR